MQEQERTYIITDIRKEGGGHVATLALSWIFPTSSLFRRMGGTKIRCDYNSREAQILVAYAGESQRFLLLGHDTRAQFSIELAKGAFG